jgi:hypothetical protein
MQEVALMDELRKIVHEILHKHVIIQLEKLTDQKLDEHIRKIIRQEMQKDAR